MEELLGNDWGGGARARIVKVSLSDILCHA
jgi:hypothetical protein